ncbi:MAG: LytTR family DNA-binding domain-containing protein [Gordonibacter sp.]|uniref:LytR/AlgR family response regulator transcription factor n=1 Tax=Gordonibacter sp. TaxID=1968902 RepID=UPI002FC9DF61
MPRIALCDDDANDLRSIAAIIRQYQNTHLDAQLFLETFPSGEELLDAVRSNGPFDLYLLDAVMPHMNGIELGSKLRTHDHVAQIAYVTVSPAFAVDSYKVHAFHYLLKPVTDKDMVPLLDEALARFREKDEGAHCVRTKGGIRRMLVREVASVELRQRQVRYHLADGSDIFSVSLRSSFAEAIVSLLDDRRFVLTSTSFAVNVAYVTSVQKSSAMLFDGEAVPITRMHRLAVKQAWEDYWLS